MNYPLTWRAITLIVIAAFVVFNLLFMLILVPHLVFYNTVYRNPKKYRVRECTNKKDPDQVKMFNEGIAWANNYNDKRIPLEIVHDGLSLKGEYIDFGAKKCAIILQGRTESLLYSYYFAKPYADAGYNIFVVDLRAHGLSDGKFQTGGVKESGDLVAWIDYLTKNFKIESFIFHGLCIGAATSVYAALHLEQRGYPKVEKIITDGLFATYFEMYEKNFASYKKKPFPMLYLTFFIARIYTGINFYKNRPIDAVSNLNCPILFIYSAEDQFCPRESSLKMYSMCKNKASEIIFFPHGRHSHVRSLNTAEYDEKIKQFIVNN